MLLTKALGLSVGQQEVDFVVPDLNRDRPLCIDPFLLFKSRDPDLRQIHADLIGVFNSAFQAYGSGNLYELHRLIDFPEVSEIGLGYTEGGVRGSGMGSHLNQLVADTLAANPILIDRGISHVEELQIIGLGIGPDRISDAVANLLKDYLATYTVRQCELVGIKVVRDVPLPHVFDRDDRMWHDQYRDLPLNPLTGSPLLFVPRRMVRILPWINFADFERTELRLFLQSKGRGSLPSVLSGGSTARRRSAQSKTTVASILSRHIDVLDRYVAKKEAASNDAIPQLTPIDEPDARHSPGTELAARLDTIPHGTEANKDFRILVLTILTYLFEPLLTDGQIEVRTIHGTERRDIIYTIEAEGSFWAYVRQEYHSPLIMFETKNVADVTNDHLSQTATYLGDRLGYLGFIVGREPLAKPQRLKCYSIFNDSNGRARKVVLGLCDADLKAMLAQRDAGQDPTRYLQARYREFKVSLQ